jgi:hypothetical protein
VFPAFGINSENFWRRCCELVRDDGYDYRPNTHLRMLLEQMVEEIANRIVAQRTSAAEGGIVRARKH